MTYKDLLTEVMSSISRDSRAYFIGYNTKKGPRMNGTLSNVPEYKCIEMPVAENLMCGVAIGMALEGFIPIICFERMDFMLTCADQIINHIAALPYISGNRIKLPIIIRACVGHFEPLDPGVQHCMDYTSFFKSRLYTKMLYTRDDIINAYNTSTSRSDPILLVEYKKLYNNIV